jgi:hypothetical protein
VTVWRIASCTPLYVAADTTPTPTPETHSAPPRHRRPRASPARRSAGWPGPTSGPGRPCT